MLHERLLFQSQIQVQMSMEISPQHHSIVLGKQSSNLKMIMTRTATQIMFPDAGDPNIPSLKKSNVTITGAIHNVYLARQQLVVRQYVSEIINSRLFLAVFFLPQRCACTKIMSFPPFVNLVKYLESIYFQINFYTTLFFNLQFL